MRHNIGHSTNCIQKWNCHWCFLHLLSSPLGLTTYLASHADSSIPAFDQFHVLVILYCEGKNILFEGEKIVKKVLAHWSQNG